ncbi:acyltransferase [Herbaspirillum sp. WKF16]|uniref:acyltransferase family protein n=1 Tax=Herbaspirillum sp. WKF16 TaxID=3028312 RepID=UPI0023A9DF76|nr:acyltransferase [Herbaspirillum sp. WKF16]WDZ97912.1 acyltransferase [Herbaspirillum sp. WKF16]
MSLAHVKEREAASRAAVPAPERAADSLVHTKHKEIASLDGWRAVAIAIVFLSHAGLGKIIPGGLGVTIFFFLSGYLITTLLVREFTASGGINIRHFYVRRVLRLTPPLLLVLAVTYLLTHYGLFTGHAAWSGFFAQLFYFANYYVLFFDAGNAVPQGTGVFWSLAVEEHFYFVFPALFMLLMRRADHRRIPLYLFGLCLAFLAWRYYLVAGEGVSMERTYYATDTRIDSILFGCILATLQLPESLRATLQRPALRMAGVGAGVLLLLLSLLVRDAVFRETLRYSVQGIALIPLFFYSVTRPDSFPFRWLNLRWVQRLGIYSYSIYLSHEIMLSNVDWVSANPALNIAAALVFSLLFAMLVDRFIDAPLRAVRARFR